MTEILTLSPATMTSITSSIRGGTPSERAFSTKLSISGPCSSPGRRKVSLIFLENWKHMSSHMNSSPLVHSTRCAGSRVVGSSSFSNSNSSCMSRLSQYSWLSSTAVVEFRLPLSVYFINLRGVPRGSGCISQRHTRNRTTGGH